MNGNENLSCALPHKLNNWETILWRKVIQHVTRLQRRIAKAAKSCNDAVAGCFQILCRKISPQWIFEADIKACFDNIRHDWILKNIPVNKTILNEWLKAGYIEKKRLFPTEKGTPQGGTISPMIMNMVLDGLETAINKKFPRWKNKKVNFIRYADDFVITAISKEVITDEIIPLVDKIRKIINENRGIPAHALIRILNPVIRGWSNYHKGICSKRIFNRLGSFIWWQLRRWRKYQHGNKNRWWIFHRYFRDNHFTDQRITKNGTENHRLYRIGYVPIRYHVKVKAEANPFLLEFDNYFCNRTKRRADLAKECKQITTFMSNKKSNISRVTLRRVSLKSA